MLFPIDFRYSAVGYNFLLATFVIEWALIVRGYMFDFSLQTHKFPIDVERMISADFVAAAVLISFGAVVGKTNPTQLIIMGFIEVLLQSSNQFLGIHRFCAYDIGQSMFIHVFGTIGRQTFSRKYICLIFLSFPRCFLWNCSRNYAL